MNLGQVKWGFSTRYFGVALCICTIGNTGALQADKFYWVPQKTSQYVLALAPSVALSYRDNDFDSSFSAELHLLRYSPSERWSIVGMAVGGTRYASYDATRLNLDFYAGVRTVRDLPIGLSLGPSVDVFEVGRRRVGYRATLWAYAGVSPYLRVSSIEGLGAPNLVELEIGLTLPLAAFRW